MREGLAVHGDKVVSMRWNEEHSWKDGRTCACRVCGGRVVSDVRRQFVHEHPIRCGGPPPARRIIHNGYYCESCGIKYKMIVGNISEMTREELERHE